MLIAAGTLTEFIKFLQIFLWITIPILLSAIIITTIIHYKRKNRKRASDDQAIMENIEYSFLKKDLQALEEKYNQLLLHNNNNESSKIFTMDHSAEVVQREMQFQLDRQREDYASEKENLLDHLSILNGRCQQLEEENKSLKEHSSFIENGIDDSLISRLQKERTELRNKVSELQYNEDMLEEKQLHINFLQQQLDQRIKNYHNLEQQFADAAADNMEIRQTNEFNALRINSLEKEIIERDQQDQQLQELFEEKNSTIGMLTEDLRINADRVTYFESTINDLRQRNEQLAKVADEKEALVNKLRIQLEAVEEKISKLSAKLDSNRKLMVKMKDEMSSVLQEDNRSSPVITMKTDYLLSGNDDEIVASSQSL